MSVSGTERNVLCVCLALRETVGNNDMSVSALRETLAARYNEVC